MDVAHKGGDAVRRTIDGMNAIRETIQETSKRIKRLGESSQEIGNIVELINDIAEQTNILALNASIQASMAGEAGRGFAVVADEVQRLAERAANATKQIEVLVRTIQTDTNEAVVSMERSTTDVVGGALLAENAGAALEEIEQVSNQIASLVQNISASARQQAAASGKHRAQHAGGQRDHAADRRVRPRHVRGHRQARRAVGAAAQVRCSASFAQLIVLLSRLTSRNLAPSSTCSRSGSGVEPRDLRSSTRRWWCCCSVSSSGSVCCRSPDQSAAAAAEIMRQVSHLVPATSSPELGSAEQDSGLSSSSANPGGNSRHPRGSSRQIRNQPWGYQVLPMKFAGVD